MDPGSETKTLRWEFTEYEILNFELTDQYVVVFASLGDDGFTDLFSEPCDAIGLARATTKFVEGYPGKCYHREYEERDVRNILVGLQLFDGAWHVANDSSNFSGITKAGEDIWRATDFLDRHAYKTLRHEPDRTGDA